MFIIKKNLVSLSRKNKKSSASRGAKRLYLDRNENPIKYDMKKIDGGAVMCGYGSASWE